jgi:hypothetical protein
MRDKLSQAALDVLTERRRQIEGEGWTSGHDDEHKGEELIATAVCYLLPSNILNFQWPGRKTTIFDVLWPWSLDWWKPKSRRRDLVRAAALIIAEIERLDRRSISNKVECEG